MKKKKLKCLAICLLMVMVLSACGKEEAPAEMPVPEPQDDVITDEYDCTLRISEVMAKNGAVLQSSDGFFHDWIEVENISSKAVPLSGWSLEINGELYSIHSETVLEPNALFVIYATGGTSISVPYVDCKIAPGDVIALVSLDGSVSDVVECFEENENISIAVNSEGVFESCIYPTPGAANSGEGYDAFCRYQKNESPLIISEIMGKNAMIAQCDTGYKDWIELCNISSSAVQLSDYYLSDDKTEPLKFQLPDRILAPNEKVVVWCTGDAADSDFGYIHANFKINGSGESVFLSTSDGYADFAAYPSIPTDWSFGRLKGENGWFLFTKPTPGSDNSTGFRRMAAQPEALTPPGCYNDIDSIWVELSGDGAIHYTLDGSLPNKNSPIYSEPIEISKTTVIRCFCLKEGLAKSPERTLSYFVNENHSLPVLSLVTDDYYLFSSVYFSATDKYKPREKMQASLSLYDSGEVFSKRGVLTMKGWTSLSLPKKSMGFDFDGTYGDGSAVRDIFEDGEHGYSSLSIRAGQDYTFSVIRNELIQSLCMESTNNVPTQHGKYCALYINGEYWGLYCLKENISDSFYSDLKGVKENQVLKSRSPVSKGAPVATEVFEICANSDLSIKENYDYFCSVFDIDNLIDWIILEAFSANTDINGNMRYFRTQEGKWQIVLYDLDWSLKSENNGNDPFGNILSDKTVQVTRDIIQKLMNNEEFCAALYLRANELFNSTLSNENVLEKIDELAAEIEPEIPRDRERWGLHTASWYTKVDQLKSFIVDYNWDESCLNALKKYLKIQ